MIKYFVASCLSDLRSFAEGGGRRQDRGIAGAGLDGAGNDVVRDLDLKAQIQYAGQALLVWSP